MHSGTHIPLPAVCLGSVAWRKQLLRLRMLLLAVPEVLLLLLVHHAARNQCWGSWCHVPVCVCSLTNGQISGHADCRLLQRSRSVVERRLFCGGFRPAKDVLNKGIFPVVERRH